MSLEEIKDEFPSHGVERFANIKLEEERWNFVFVESSCNVPNLHEIVMDTSLFYEGALGMRDKIVHKWSKPEGNHFYDNISNAMDQDYRPILGDVLGPSFFGKRTILAELTH